MVHGLSIPIGKLGYHLSVPRFLSRAVDAESRNLPEPMAIRGSAQYEGQILGQGTPQNLERSRSDGPQLMVVPVDGSLRHSRTGKLTQVTQRPLESINSVEK